MYNWQRELRGGGKASLPVHVFVVHASNGSEANVRYNAEDTLQDFSIRTVDAFALPASGLGPGHSLPGITLSNGPGHRRLCENIYLLNITSHYENQSFPTKLSKNPSKIFFCGTHLLSHLPFGLPPKFWSPFPVTLSAS